MVVSDVLLAKDEGLRETVRRRLLHVAEVDAELRSIAKQTLELAYIVRGGYDQDVADAREDEGGQRIVDHWLVIDRDQLFRDAMGDRVQAGAGSARKNEALHETQSRQLDRVSM